MVRVEDSERCGGSACEPLSEITPWLFLGSHGDALNTRALQEKGITYVLNTAKECESGDSTSSDSSGCETPEGHTKDCVWYLKLDWTDTADESITGEFQRAFAFIEKARSEGKKVCPFATRNTTHSVS